MLKQRLSKLEKQINEIKQMNKRLILILHFVDDNTFEYKGMKYNTLEKLKRENHISENDNVMITSIKYV